MKTLKKIPEKINRSMWVIIQASRMEFDYKIPMWLLAFQLFAAIFGLSILFILWI